MILLLAFSLVLSLSASPVIAGQWVNPKEVIGDPDIARLRPGKKELTEREKKDIKKYGYTGLELMVYLDDNKDAGEDSQYLFRRYYVSRKGNITTFEGAHIRKYYYKDHRALITYDGIKPGEVQRKIRGFALFPPTFKGSSVIFYTYLREKIDDEIETGWRYNHADRRVGRRLNDDRTDTMGGSQITWDDLRWREPWEENHKIVGEDTVDGIKCFVVESVNLDPNYYLSKRLTWIEKRNFIDPHEEQFDRKGKLVKIIAREWKQIEPWNYWAKMKTDYYNVLTNGRTVSEFFHYLFDQHPNELLFEPQTMQIQNEFPKELKPIPLRIRISAKLHSKPESRNPEQLFGGR
mgnify:CR=1 FL=1